MLGCCPFIVRWLRGCANYRNCYNFPSSSHNLFRVKGVNPVSVRDRRDVNAQLLHVYDEKCFTPSDSESDDLWPRLRGFCQICRRSIVGKRTLVLRFGTSHFAKLECNVRTPRPRPEPSASTPKLHWTLAQRTQHDGKIV